MSTATEMITATKPVLFSYVAWRNAGYSMQAPVLVQSGLCAICQDHRRFRLPAGKEFYCLCQLVLEIELFQESIKRLKSPIREREWGEIDPDISQRLPEEAKTQEQKDYCRMRWHTAYETVERFLHHPAYWMYLAGLPGVGKTMMCGAIMRAYGPVALYMNAADFERKVFQCMRNDELEQLTQILVNAPLLVIDDLGMDYGTKKKPGGLVMTVLDNVIDLRYTRWREKITVVASNHGAKDLPGFAALQELNPRVASRMLDEEVSRYLPINLKDGRYT